MKTKYLLIFGLLGYAMFKKDEIVERNIYGLSSPLELESIINEVVRVFGGGSNAILLLNETAQIESHKGTYLYNPYRDYGLGVMQFDRIGFDDTIARTSQQKKLTALNSFGIDLNNVVYEDLRFNPTLGVILARLKYMLVPSAIPSTIEGRAFYWYKYYNGGGAGTETEGVQKYLSANGVI